jgi:protein O-GlcNAc transferase
MSSDFVNHPTADLIIRALLLHNGDEFETFCYSLAKDDHSSYRRVLEKEIKNFRFMPKNLSDRKCAEMIADDGIHILVNLNGHTAGDRNGISALRPAPLQIVYLAYPGTMGAKYIDYNVVDKHVCPDQHRAFYTEHLMYMPHSYQANSFKDLYKQLLSHNNRASRADYQVPEEAFVFCNFCRLGRITHELFSVWLRILERVPGSVLWLYKHPRAAMYRLQEAARDKDPALVGRILFAPPCSPKLEHLKRVSLADLCLDTTVYNGHTTGSDMLWAGVPMLTVEGDNWPSRVAYCLAHCIDMPQMVMKDLKQYEDTAVFLAENPNDLSAWRAKLAANRLTSPLFDTERWVRSFEDGLHQMWDLWTVYTLTHTHTHTHKHTHKHTHTHKYINAYTYIRMYIHTYIHTYTHTHNIGGAA